MSFHSNETGLSALHPVWLAQNGDPGAIGAGKLWLDTTSGSTLMNGGVLKQRNTGDTGWNTIIDMSALTASTPSYGDNDTSIATTAFVQSALSKKVADGSLGATPTTDWSAGNIHTGTLTANATFTFTAPSPAVGVLILVLTQDGTGGWTATWPGSVKWASATAPTITVTAGAIDILTFYYDGTNYYGVTSGQAYG